MEEEKYYRNKDHSIELNNGFLKILLSNATSNCIFSDSILSA